VFDEDVSTSRPVEPSLVWIFESSSLSNLSALFAHNYYERFTAKRSQFSSVPTILFSEVVTPQVEDHLSALVGCKFHRFRRSFYEPKIFLEVLQRENVNSLIAWIEKHSFQDEYGIIFCSTNCEAEKTSAFLNNTVIASAFYHSLMTSDQTTEVVSNWEQGAIKTIVMVPGTEIPFQNIAYCIYLCFPRNLETFFLHCACAKLCCAVMMSRMDEVLLKRGVRDETQVRRVMNFVGEKYSCRHLAIAAELGETVEATCEKHCDLCLRKWEQMVAKVLAEGDIGGLVAHMREKEEFRRTPAYLSAILRGKIDQKIQEMGDHELPWFGRLSAIENAYIIDAFDALVARKDLKWAVGSCRFGAMKYLSRL
jgi:superfamily II DNA helicase RecQ